LEPRTKSNVGLTSVGGNSNGTGSVVGYNDWLIEPVGTSGRYVVAYTKVAANITAGDTTTMDVEAKLFDANNNLISTQLLGDVEVASKIDAKVQLSAVGTTGSYVVSWVGTDSAANGGDTSTG
jgi:hypothetical protein